MAEGPVGKVLEPLRVYAPQGTEVEIIWMTPGGHILTIEAHACPPQAVITARRDHTDALLKARGWDQ